MLDETDLRLLMIAGLAGDAQAYRRLLDCLGGTLRRYFLRRLGSDKGADAEDLVQETLAGLHQKRATYDPGQPLTAWVHAIARYKMIDHFRRRRIRIHVPIDDAHDLFEPDRSAAVMARIDIERMLDGLPTQSRAILKAVRLDGRDVADVARERGVTESAIRVSIHRSLKTLAERFQERNET